MTAWAYDASRDMIDVVTSDGALRGWSIRDQAWELSVQINGTPGSLDVSADGHYALVGNRTPITTSDPFAFQKTYADQLTRIDLGSHAVDRLQVNLTDMYEAGVSHVAITSSGTALFTTGFNGSGWEPLRSFDINTSNFATATVTNIGGTFSSAGNGGSYLIDSESHGHVLMEELYSNGAMHIFSAASNSLTAQNDLYNIGSSGYQYGGGAVSDAAGLVLDVIGNVYVFDLAMHPVANLSVYSQTGPVADGAFSADGHDIFLWQASLKQVLIIDTASWLQVGSFAVSTGSTDFGGHYQMQVVDGGTMLALSGGSGIELVDLTGKIATTVPGQVLSGTPNADTLLGGAGDDTISGGSGGANYLRGNAGDDTISGGLDFDDINGNQGNDTAHGNAGDDWVVGGKDNDLLFGDAGGDIVWGNLGNDTCDGGDGADQVRGGQGDDSVSGGAGNDYVSGDRGSDTVSGGAGADLFHTFSGAGLDKVLDFHLAEGDRVMLDPGTTYTLSQVGADTVIDMGNGDQMILVGVTLSTLTPGWIFGG
jgi:Ca2+-binding RTX toxin-like protein